VDCFPGLVHSPRGGGSKPLKSLKAQCQVEPVGGTLTPRAKKHRGKEHGVVLLVTRIICSGLGEPRWEMRGVLDRAQMDKRKEEGGDATIGLKPIFNLPADT
jgi:hypothetical protein